MISRFLVLTVSCFVFIALVAAGLYFVFSQSVKEEFVPLSAQRAVSQFLNGANYQDRKLSEISEFHEKVLHDVPFTPQAPLGEWDDPRQQDGCEEAASLMAVRWAKGQDLSREEAKEIIIDASLYQQEVYGSWRDTSARDTADRIIRGYFNYQNIEVHENATTADIKQVLYEGNVVIAPFDGRKLANPYYTQPGPERHMLVIIGYDPARDEFITNDNGTRRGKGFRYKSDVIKRALRDYPSGDHEPIISHSAVMIVVRR